MDQQPQSNDQFWIGSLHRWHAVFWLLLGLVPPALAVLDDSSARTYWSLGLLAVLALCYPIGPVFPGRPVLRPHVYLGVLVVGLGAMAYLLGGEASMFVVALPQFWVFARSPRSAAVWSGVAAAVTLGCGSIEGVDAEIDAVIVLGYAAGVVIGVWVHRVIEQNNERARRLRAELAAAESALAAANQRRGAVEERERMARDIHDTLAQGFASIVVLAEAARLGFEKDPGRSRAQLVSIENTARENLAEARVLVGSAPQSGVAPGSVATSLRRTLERFAEDTDHTVSAELPDIDCDQQTRIALLRCLQESLANIRKHAAAAHVGVVLAELAPGIELEITDDGKGFVVGESQGFGLDGMRRRLAELGGELTVTSSLGDGTRVLAVLPVNGPA
ncbi:sensor histidine kinase [Streptomyces sp. NBC_01465]|uniref:sensor histidine kinase n=1 Tax=Streptomyces sp. NBC_01465 TaxID=2903878 RepID=UPI002E32BF47|nr:sensor histidine kinase [Streptomyces sp. NBC_01465]